MIDIDPRTFASKSSPKTTHSKSQGTALGVKHHGFPIDFSRFSQPKITKELLEWLPSSRHLTGRPLDLRLLRAMLLQLPRQLRSGPETRQRLCLGFMVEGAGGRGGYLMDL